MKDAFNVPHLHAFQPMSNPPERRRKCFIIGLKGIPMANAPNVGSKSKAIMESLAYTVDGATLR